MKNISIKNIKLVGYWVITIGIGVYGAWLCFTQTLQSAFRDNFLGNLLATIIGVIAGIPVALWVSHLQQDEQEKIDERVKEREGTERTIKILVLVKNELEFNLEILEDMEKGLSEFKERFLPLDSQKDELWNAFSDGGELQWIKDLQLLNTIATAYYDIRRVMHVQKLLLDSKRPENYITDLAIYRGDWLISISPEVIASVRVALYEITKSIENLRTKLD